MKIYVASSWRNKFFDEVYTKIVNKFPHAYNFKENGFHWSKVIGSNWVDVSLDAYLNGLDHPLAEQGFIRDDTALRTSKATVMVLPCGSSAHLELGVAVGLQQFTAIYAPVHIEPELMYKFVDIISDDLDEIISTLLTYEREQWSTGIVTRRIH